MSIRDDLKAYVDGELSPERAAEVRAAVEADPALLQEVEFMKALGFEIKRLAKDPQPVGYESTMKAVGRKRKIWWSPANLAVAAVAVLFVVGGAAVLFPTFAQSKYSARRMSRDESVATTSASRMPDAMGTESKGGFAGRGAGEEPADGTSATGKADYGDVSPPPAAAAAPMRPQEYAKKETGTTTFGINERKSMTNSPSSEDVTIPRPSTEEPNAPRMVVQTAQIDLQVADAKRSLNDAMTMTQGLGGFVESSGISGAQGGLPTATATLRVPQPKFSVAMQRLRDMGDVLSESSSGDDVTGQYADVDARLKVLRTEEEQYRTILGQTKKISDILEVKDRLGQVRQEIESLDAQRVALKNQARLSTITASFQQSVAVGKPEPPSNWLEEIWATSINALSTVGVLLAKVGVFVFVFSPIWLPLAAIVWWWNKRGKVGK